MVRPLSIDHRGDGFTLVEYDALPHGRIQLLTLTDLVHDTLSVPADTLLGYTLATERPPVSSQTTRKGGA